MNFPPFTRHELRQLVAWDGPLLPYEPIDYAHMIEHGTDRGYQQHRRYQIPYCDDCREAHRQLRQQDRAA